MERKRKRTAIACFNCRRRKKGCDGAQPSCVSCQRAGLTCEYESGNDSLQTQTAPAITDQGRLHEKVEALEATVRDLIGRAQSAPKSPSFTNDLTCFLDPPRVADPSHDSVHPTLSRDLPAVLIDDGHLASSARPAVQTAAQQVRPSAGYLPIVIPPGHVTTSGSLLMHSRLRALVGRNPSNIFTTTDIKRPALAPSSTSPGSKRPVANIDHEVAMNLCDRYITYVHSFHPILDTDHCRLLCAKIATDGSASLAEAAVCYAIFALAETSSSVHTAGELADDDWCPGYAYLQASLAIAARLHNSALDIRVELPQALYLCALFTMRYETKAEWTSNQTLLRPAWAIFVFECDLLAEHHFPRSGIEQVVADMPFPREASNHWLSELSIRSLLNRVHFAIHDAGSANPSPGKVDSLALRAKQHMLRLVSSVVLQELASQLDAWHDMLPTASGQCDDALPLADKFGLYLRIRYHSAREVINRPCLLQVIDATAEPQIANGVLARAEVCIQSCIAYLEAAGHWLKTSSSSTATFCHSVFAFAIMLTLAASTERSPQVTEDIEAHQSRALKLLQRWAFNGSAIEWMYHLLSTARQKMRGRRS